MEENNLLNSKESEKIKNFKENIGHLLELMELLIYLNEKFIECEDYPNDDEYKGKLFLSALCVQIRRIFDDIFKKYENL